MGSRPDNHHRALAGAVVALAVAAFHALPAQASEPLSDKNVTNVKLAVNTKGEALITYTRANGRLRHVLVWGAVNALAPNPELPQAHFHSDYAGGWGKYHKLDYWKTFKNACRPYDGPLLAVMVTACTAPDGSYWALQSWQRSLPLLGFAPWTAAQSAYELQVSHWTGPLAQLTVVQHWTYGDSAVGLFGQVTYGGQPVYGFSATPSGNPHDRYSRNVYIDTDNSAYGPGWARESGILLHAPNGTFCHSFVPQTPFPGYPNGDMRPAAPGDRYRVTLSGPGVTPTIQWEEAGISPSWTGSAGQQATQAEADAEWRQFMTEDKKCAPEQG
jgi:hypothetical protein